MVIRGLDPRIHANSTPASAWPDLLPQPQLSMIAGSFVSVMPAHSRSKNGVASLAYVAGIRVYVTSS